MEEVAEEQELLAAEQAAQAEQERPVLTPGTSILGLTEKELGERQDAEETALEAEIAAEEKVAEEERQAKGQP